MFCFGKATLGNIYCANKSVKYYKIISESDGIVLRAYCEKCYQKSTWYNKSTCKEITEEKYLNYQVLK